MTLFLDPPFSRVPGELDPSSEGLQPVQEKEYRPRVILDLWTLPGGTASEKALPRTTPARTSISKAIKTLALGCLALLWLALPAQAELSPDQAQCVNRLNQ